MTRTDHRCVSKILNSLHKGDELSDNDLIHGIDILAPLVGMMKVLRDERYRLTINEMEKDLRQMESFKQAREI